MRNVRRATRLRARLLRAFKGRSAEDAAWGGEVASAGAAESFEVGGLVVEVAPRGLKAAGDNPPAIVYTVTIHYPDGSLPWSSSYGFPPRQASAREAANAALDELDEIARDRAAWLRRVTEGMSVEEAEAMEDSPGVVKDLAAAGRVGPRLEPLRGGRAASGGWVHVGAPGEPPSAL
ncbi:MAG: hypothetical protein NVSMB17_11090 [Candidatus Dormibacteria bacterium]